jgi:ABC-type multidrug transport system permease subunit
MISYFRVQAGLATAIALLVLMFHFVTRVVPGFSAPWSGFEAARVLPYISAIGAVVVCLVFAADRQRSYANFLSNSPGITVDTSAVTYGTGHTVD